MYNMSLLESTEIMLQQSIRAQLLDILHHVQCAGKRFLGAGPDLARGQNEALLALVAELQRVAVLGADLLQDEIRAAARGDIQDLTSAAAFILCPFGLAECLGGAFCEAHELGVAGGLFIAIVSVSFLNSAQLACKTYIQ